MTSIKTETALNRAPFLCKQTSKARFSLLALPIRRHGAHTRHQAASRAERHYQTNEPKDYGAWSNFRNNAESARGRGQRSSDNLAVDLAGMEIDRRIQTCGQDVAENLLGISTAGRSQIAISTGQIDKHVT